MTMELYDKDLEQWLDDKEVEQEDKQDVGETVILDIVRGLTFIHSSQHIHNDLKPKNILIKTGENGRIEAVALADFGLAKLITDPQVVPSIVHRSGTTFYNSAPDAIYSLKFDMWSLGLIAYQIGVGKIATSQELDNIIKRAKTEEGLDAIPCLADVNDKIHNIVVRCLNKQPATRCSAEELEAEFDVTLPMVV